jgi:site-specific DNA-methyltransferase (adenine-specific)
VLATGTGALNVDGCRVEGVKERPGNKSGFGEKQSDRGWGTRIIERPADYEHQGRWPANLCHDGSPEVMAAFEKFGGKGGGHYPQQRTANAIYGGGKGTSLAQKGGERPMDGYGTAARFFYSAKASRAERAGSKHPTVKPLALMRWLCRLITPPGGVVLDPFAGSGTTGEAALREGLSAVLIEREAEYHADILARLARYRDEAPLLAEVAA